MDESQEHIDRNTVLKDGYVRILREIKAEYHPINQPIRLKVSEDGYENIASVGKHIILNGSEPVKEGTLIQLRFDLKGHSKHRFGNCNMPVPEKTFIGIGQVISILESSSDRYKMLTSILDLRITK